MKIFTTLIKLVVQSIPKSIPEHKDVCNNVKELVSFVRYFPAILTLSQPLKCGKKTKYIYSTKYTCATKYISDTNHFQILQNNVFFTTTSDSHSTKSEFKATIFPQLIDSLDFFLYSFYISQNDSINCTLQQKSFHPE